MVQLTDRHWAVEVQEDAHHFGVNLNVLYYCFAGMSVSSKDSRILLPPGSWQYLFTTQGATEEDARLLVAWFEIEGRTGYYNYMDAEPYRYLGDHKQSIESLLKSKGCDTGKNHAILKNNSNE